MNGSLIAAVRDGDVAVKELEVTGNAFVPEVVRQLLAPAVQAWRSYGTVPYVAPRLKVRSRREIVDILAGN